VGLRAVERRLERLVEGTVGLVFRNDLRPVELGRRLVREMDDGRTVGIHGETVAPNAFRVLLAPADHDRLSGLEDSLVRELADSARDHAREEGYTFAGPVVVQLRQDKRLRTGSFRIQAAVRESPGGRPPGSVTTPTGDRLTLGERVVTIGRLPDCSIPLSDPNASRVHAEIRPAGTGWVIVDLGSTNGTRVNGDRIGERRLRDGDVIAIGTTTLRFDAS
jgi:hypothetical protein